MFLPFGFLFLYPIDIYANTKRRSPLMNLKEIKYLIRYLYQKHGSLLLSTKEVAREINKSEHWLYLSRKSSIGPSYIKEKTKGVRYRIDHIAAYIYYGNNGYMTMQEEEIKNFFIDMLYADYKCQVLTRVEASKTLGRSTSWLSELNEGPAYRKNTDSHNGEVRYHFESLIDYVLDLTVTKTVSNHSKEIL